MFQMMSHMTSGSYYYNWQMTFKTKKTKFLVLAMKICCHEPSEIESVKLKNAHVYYLYAERSVGFINYEFGWRVTTQLSCASASQVKSQ